MKMMKKNGGFTLVELIVVIAILAILAGVAIPAYSGYIKKAKDAAVITELDAIQTAVQAANATAGSITIIELDDDGQTIKVTANPTTLATGFEDDFAMFYGVATLEDDKVTLKLATKIELKGTSYENGAVWYATQQLEGETVTYEAGWNAVPAND